MLISDALLYAQGERERIAHTAAVPNTTAARESSTTTEQGGALFRETFQYRSFASALDSSQAKTGARASPLCAPQPSSASHLSAAVRGMEQPAGLPAYRAVAAAARLALPSADIIGSYSPHVGAARRLSEPPVVWPNIGGPAVPMSQDALYDEQLSQATNISSERRMGPPSTSAESCSQHCTPAPPIRSVSASVTEPTARHETIYMPSVLKTPMASSTHELAWSPASAVNALLFPQQGEGSPPETQGSSEQTKYVFGSSMFTRDGSQPACRTPSRSPSSSPPHSGGEVATARSLPRQLEPPASAAYRARQPTSFRSLEREAAAIGARGRGEWARPPPDRPTHASSGWAHSKRESKVKPQSRRSEIVTPNAGFL